MANTDPEKIGKTFEKVAKSKEEDTYVAEELYYDRNSNMLSVSKKGEVNNDPDRIPATSMAREGFF